MIFKEVIQQILFESGFDKKELADELGISFLQVENLRTGVTKKPSERIYQKLQDFCKKNNIELDVDWNDVLYDIFENSSWKGEYVWYSDLNSDNFVTLRHRECGKKTLVPLDAFGGSSTPCIHCWVEKYVSSEVYSYTLSEHDHEHIFEHKCGHSYTVTYDEIKRKKFRCPKCSGYRYNANNLHSNELVRPYIKSGDIPVAWSESTKQRIEDMALEYEFSIEESDSVYCLLQYPSMDCHQFALVCKKCFSSTVFKKDDNVLQDVLNYLINHADECEPLDYCIAKATKEQSIIWIPDVERILHMASLTAQPNNPLYSMIEKLSSEGYSKEVYIAGVTDRDTDNTVYLFYHYSNDDVDTEYVDLLLSLTPEKFGQMTFHSYPRAYTDLLFQYIKSSMDRSVLNSDALQKSCDEYVDIVNYFKVHNNQIYLFASISKFADKLSAIAQKTSLLQRQEEVEKILSVQHCPVCQNLHNSNAILCDECGFDELNRMFINKDEYQMWLNDVVIPARKKREN